MALSGQPYLDLNIQICLTVTSLRGPGSPGPRGADIGRD